MVVVRTYAGLGSTFNIGVEPVTWLHEFGHTQGLQHNTRNIKDVMSPGISPGTTEIAQQECSIFATSQQNSPALLGAAAPMPRGSSSQHRAAASRPTILPAEGGNSGTSPKAVSLKDFIKLPFNQSQVALAQRYKPSVNEAERLLSDPMFADYKNNIVGLLAVIGTPGTIPVLETLIKSPITGGVSGPDALAHFAALTSIGAIANRYKLPDTKVSILKDAQDPKFWESYIKPSNSGEKGALDESDAQSLAQDLAVQSLTGYALTGTKKAEDFLKAAKKDIAHGALPAPVQKERGQVLDQAIRLNNESASKGALSTFQK
jgi:hypothetical protein